LTDTYTFTARSAENPQNVVTFTLEDHSLQINLTGLLEPLNNIKDPEEMQEQAKRMLRAQLKPGVLKFVEGFTGPVPVSDVEASLHGDDFHLTAWQRMMGLRLVPVRFKMAQVDNLEAAEGFVEELAIRKKEAGWAGTFFGPLDYWVGWLGLVLLIMLLVRWPKKRS
jgi:hypothetical protein